MAREDGTPRAGDPLVAFREQVHDEQSTYFVAEAGVNHNGDRETAAALVEAAAESGADAVKFQTFSADRLVTPDTPQAEYQRERAPSDSQYEMLERYELDRDDHESLREQCSDLDIAFLSTPFDPESASLLDELGVPVFKLSSGDLDNHPLIEHVAGFGRPMIISTGMGTLPEVRAALEVVAAVDPTLEVVLTHCTSAYPTAVADVNLRAMETMASEFDVPVGYSDHTTSVAMPGFAAAAGAAVLEKHFTLDTAMEGPDHEASLEPDELSRAVTRAREGARARGEARKQPVEAELENRRVVRKSLHASRPIEAGERFSEDAVAVLRPAAGLSPAHYDAVIGRASERDLDPGQPIAMDDVAGDLDPTPGGTAPRRGGQEEADR